MNTNPLLGGGPKTKAKDLAHGDWLMITWGKYTSPKKWRVNFAGPEFVQITDHEYSFSDEVKTMTFDELDQYHFTHFGQDAPIWKTILSLGAHRIDKF